MKVISVNISLPREINWKGRTVMSSILKIPVPGRVKVLQLHLEGDGQADLIAHGGEHRAVFVYQRESYEYWNNYLKRDDLNYGELGENLTIEGLADVEVCIGDQYQIGSAIFEVTQPRVTCYKVGISSKNPEMPALLVAHKRPGFYFRVIKEGDVGTGDVINKLKSGPEAMSIVQIDQLLYSNQHPTDRLIKALQIPALSKGWRASFNELLNAALKGVKAGNAGLNKSASVAWAGFKPFKIQKINDGSPDVRAFELIPAESLKLPEFLPGQHIALRVYINNNPTIRMYSLCGPPKANYYRIAIKRELQGVMSQFMHHEIKEGDIVEISAPRGEFFMSEADYPIILLSAGVGITPILGMLYSLSASQSTRKIFWIHSTQNGAHKLFGEQIEKLSQVLPNFKRTLIYSRPAGYEKQGVDYDLSGHLGFDVLKKLDIPLDSDCYLCGPPAYLSKTYKALKALGIPGEKIKFEAFENFAFPGTDALRKPHVPDNNTGTGQLISFVKSNISFRWNSQFNSLLEAAEAADIPVHWSCRVGVCHRCESGCLDGQVTYSPAPLDDPANGRILLCCAKPLTDIELDL